MCELILLKYLLQELDFHHPTSMTLKCDNQDAVVNLVPNPVSHKKMKHIEIDCHFVRDKVLEEVIQTMHVRSYH